MLSTIRLLTRSLNLEYFSITEFGASAPPKKEEILHHQNPPTRVNQRGFVGEKIITQAYNESRN
jgi:hypothetical protein